MSDSYKPMDYSPPGFSVYGILQTRLLEWVAISFSKNDYKEMPVGLALGLAAMLVSQSSILKHRSLIYAAAGKWAEKAHPLSM